MQKEMRGINIKNLIWRIVFSWKTILIISMIFAIMLSGYKYVTESKLYEEKENAVEEIDAAEKTNIDKLMALYDRLYYYETYLQQSLLMQIEPLKCETVKLQYYVASDYSFNYTENVENDYTSAIVAAYATYLSSENFYQNVKEDMNIDVAIEYIREIFKITYNLDSAVIELNISVPTSFDSENIITIVDNIVIEKVTEFNEIGEHTLQKMNASIDYVLYESLVSKKYEITNTIATTKQSIDTLRMSISENGLIYVEDNLKYEAYKTGVSAGAEEKPTLSIKYAMIGFILGAFIVIAYYVIIALFSNKLQDSEDIRIMYRVRCLGNIASEVGSKGPIYRILKKLRDRNMSNVTYKQQIEKIAASIGIICKNEEIKKIYISGSCMNKIKQDIIIDITKSLEKYDVNVVGNGMLSNDATSLEKAASAEHIVFIEKKFVSKYNAIEEQIWSCKDYNINVIGSIVVE